MACTPAAGVGFGIADHRGQHEFMSHITLYKKRLTGRINRLIGQLEGVRRLVEDAAQGDDVVCYKVMQQLAVVRETSWNSRPRVASRL